MSDERSASTPGQHTVSGDRQRSKLPSDPGPADRQTSKLPHDPGYWEGLAARIRDDAAAPLAAYAAATPLAADATADGRGRDGWPDVLARGAIWWLTAAGAAIAVLWLTLPPRDVSPAQAWIEASLTPDEPVGTLVSGDMPPAVDTVLVHFPPAGAERPQEERR
jgi:hypothetical protein